MHFRFIDEVLELSPERAVAVKRVGPDEPALADHFPTFPILPGVLMLETLAQAARLALAQTDPHADRFVISSVRALKFGAMVKPGMSLRVEVTLLARDPDGSCSFKGVGRALDETRTDPAEAPAAVSGKFSLRPARLDAPLAAQPGRA